MPNYESETVPEYLDSARDQGDLIAGNAREFVCSEPGMDSPLWHPLLHSLRFLPLRKDPIDWSILTHIAEQAWRLARTPRTEYVKVGRGTEVVHLDRWQIIFGERGWSADLGIPHATLGRRMWRLGTLGIVRREVRRNVTIITIEPERFFGKVAELGEAQSEASMRQQRGNNEAIFRSKEVRSKRKDQNLLSSSDDGASNGIPYEKIISLLNEHSGKSYRHTTPETRRLIRARWKAGFRQEDFEKVIRVKCAQWKTDGKMKDYLRPETLFGTKFEGYLNEQAEDEYIPPSPLDLFKERKRDPIPC